MVELVRDRWIAGTDGWDTLVATDMITVLPQAVPVVGFSLSPAAGCAPLEVAFTDESTGAVTWSSLAWPRRDT